MTIDAYIVGGVRTPVGKYGGSLAHIRLDDLLGPTIVAACERVGVPLERLRKSLRAASTSLTTAWAIWPAGRH